MIFFLDFIKWLRIQLTAWKYAIKLSVLKLCFRDDLQRDTFRIRLVDNLYILFLKAARTNHWFSDLNKSFTELKSGVKNMFWHVFEKMFYHQFYF